MSNAKRRHRRRRRELFLRYRSWISRLYALERREQWLDLDIFKGELWSDANPELRAEILFWWMTSKSGRTSPTRRSDRHKSETPTRLGERFMNRASPIQV